VREWVNDRTAVSRRSWVIQRTWWGSGQAVKAVKESKNK